MQNDFREIISEAELFSCPCSEYIRVIDFNISLQILRLDVLSLSNSYLTLFHKEIVNQALQRCTMCRYMLFTPNLCAELFTLQEYLDNSRYIVNKLVGRFDLDARWTQDIEPLIRQVWRKMLKFEDKLNRGLFFFWNREPNLILPDDKLGWRFHPESPVYKSLLDAYGKFELVTK